MSYCRSFLTDCFDDEQVSFADDDRDGHAGGWGTHKDERVQPDAVCWSESTEDVSAVLATAHEDGVATGLISSTGVHP